MTRRGSTSAEHAPRNGSQRKRSLFVVLILLCILGALVAWGVGRFWPSRLDARLACQRNMQALYTRLVSLCQSDVSDDCIVRLLASGQLRQSEIRCPACTEESCRYQILPLPEQRPLPGGTWVMVEAKSNHQGWGGNVLFADGHSSFLPEREYDAQWAAMRAAMRSTSSTRVEREILPASGP